MRNAPPPEGNPTDLIGFALPNQGYRATVYFTPRFQPSHQTDFGFSVATAPAKNNRRFFVMKAFNFQGAMSIDDAPARTSAMTATWSEPCDFDATSKAVF
jgi:hypothetical protein